MSLGDQEGVPGTGEQTGTGSLGDQEGVLGHQGLEAGEVDMTLILPSLVEHLSNLMELLSFG